MRPLPVILAFALGLAASVATPALHAEPNDLARAPKHSKKPKKPKRDPRLAMITSKGRPEVKLDRLDFPDGVPAAAYYKKYLRKRLKYETRRARWGAGRNNLIQFRFNVTELSMAIEQDAVRVRCSAVGKLPGGQAAKSRLTFSGDPGKRRKVVEHVLDIVARGVITRLAELERIRRGDLAKSTVRTPTDGE